MPRFPRNYLKTSFFHVMSQGINKNFIFEDSIDIKFYIKNMYEIKDKYNVKIIAYCIMNNHVHMLLETASVENLSRYMHCLNTRFGQYYNKKYKRVGYVFRDRYKAEGIYSEKQLYNCIKYIYDNPVKAEICKKPEEYEFSNYKKIDFIDDEESTPSLAQAIKMKKLSQDGNLDIETIHEIMEEQKANQITKFKIPEEKLMKVIPKNVDRSNVEDFVIKACEYYSKHLRQRDMGGR